MELRHLRYFIRAAEFLHFTRAAESLYVSQPTLSNHMRQLEEEIGCPLFDRLGRSVRLTQAGQLLLDHARKAVREVELSRGEISELLGLMRGELRIGTTHIFSQYLVPASLAAYISAYPEIHVQVQWGTSLEIERGVLTGAIDFGLAFLPPESNEIESEELFSDQVVLAVSGSHPLAGRTSVSIAELAEVPLALLGPTFSTRRLVDLQFAKANISPKILLEMNDIPSLLKIVGTSNAGTMVFSAIVRSRPELRAIPICGNVMRSAGILKHKGVRPSAAASAFLEILKVHCQNCT
jgi:LysR family transcriptional regulator, cyn operon transcriptional activator